MTTKQVTKSTTVTVSAPQAQATPQNNLFISIKTFDPHGKTVGERVVDLYHFGTRNWLQDHNWWAMHHGNTVEINPASPPEIEAYLEAAKQALAAKFNSEPSKKVVESAAEEAPGELAKAA